MLKIAVATIKGMVAEHFGYCENFMIFDVENKEIIKSEVVANPGHKPGFLPNFLADLGVNVIISGGIGAKAVNIFNDKNVEVIIGALGDGEKVVKEYLSGTLKSTGSVCHQHKC